MLTQGLFSENNVLTYLALSFARPQRTSFSEWVALDRTITDAMQMQQGMADCCHQQASETGIIDNDS